MGNGRWAVRSRAGRVRPTALGPVLGLVVAVASTLLTAAPAQAQAEADPPAPICDNPEFLEGPETPPEGAMVVEPGTDLGTLTDESPEGTTFWLAPGTHTLEGGEFAQVVPAAGNTYIGAPGAVLDGQGVNRTAFGQEATDVTISYLTIRNFVAPHQEGVVNHDSGDGWTITNSTIEENTGAGIMGGSGLVVRDNCLRNNGQYGANVFQVGDAQTDIVFHHNEIVGNNTDDWESQVEGCGCTGGVKFWAAVGVEITDNWVHDNRGVGVWADTNNADFLLEGNLIEENDSVGFFYETSYNAVVRDNVFRRNVLVEGPETDFPNAAIYLSESGGDPSAPGEPVIDITGNSFIDNWNGITLWENADRFCGSPANTSTGYCTYDTPFSACSPAALAHAPAYDRCRWKTQNVTVTDNLFAFDRAALECEACGINAIMSNWGSWPEWHPYQGDVVQVAITTQQGNRFDDNRYEGEWRFLYRDQSTYLDVGEWRLAGQDTDSVMGGGRPAAGSDRPVRRTGHSSNTYL